VPSNSVFISYRRSANPYLALAVYQDLRANDIDAFYDVENIYAGQFDTIILNQISARVYFMPVLTPGALDRCVEAGDWVRREIEHAMNKTRQIIPLHTPDFDFGDIDTFLPGDIARELKRWNAIEIPQKQFRLVMRDVRERILKPIDLAVKAIPKEDVPIVARKQAQAAAEPVVTEKQLTAQVYSERANVSHDLDQHFRDYSEAIRLNPRDAFAYKDRGVVRKAKGDLDGAIADYSEAIRLNPNFVIAYNNRAKVYDTKKNHEAAIADYQKALELNPKGAQANIMRAYIEYWRKRS
jgi:tetratricopeptide (TPR) repeat protein